MRKLKPIKKNPEPARGRFGINPLDPWSVKYNVAENDNNSSTEGENKMEKPKSGADKHRSHMYNTLKQIKKVHDEAMEKINKLPANERTAAFIAHVTKIRSEEVEPLDELDTKTLKSYAKKSSKDIVKRANAGDIDSTKFTNRTSSHVKAMKKIHDREPYDTGTSLKNVYKKWSKTEEVESLDELSKDTLHSYFDKSLARKKAIRKQLRAGELERDDSYITHQSKRAKGLRTALKKMYPEQVEQIDEGSLDNHDLSQLWKMHQHYHYNTKPEPGSVSSHEKSPSKRIGYESKSLNKKAARAISRHVRKKYGHDEADDMEMHSLHQTHTFHAKSKKEILHHEKEIAKLQKDNNITGIRKNIYKEEVESLDELSKNTLQSYFYKALERRNVIRRQHYAGDLETDAWHKERSKRAKGGRIAFRKMYPEQVESLDELDKQTLRSYLDKSSFQIATRKLPINTLTGPKLAKRAEGNIAAIKRIVTKNPKIFRTEEVKLDEEHLVHVNDGSKYDEEPHPKDAEHVMAGAKIHGGEFDGHSDKGAFFKFKSPEDANKFKRHVDSCPNKTCSADLLEEVEQIDEISRDKVERYISKVGDDQEKKHGFQRDMYSKLEPKRQKGVDRALDRLGSKEKEQIDERKREMSKSARMIKALYKHHKVVKEEMFDDKKEDKSVATYGKKPKISNIGTEKSATQVKPEAAIIVSGGKTQTGNKRDMIEIDPMMKRPNQPDGNKKDETEKTK